MFDIGLQEMVVIGVIALLVFGPSKLPELGRMVGRALREFRRASDEFRTTVETNLNLNDLDPISQPPTVPSVETAPPTATIMPSGAEPVADGAGAPTVATTTEPAATARGFFGSPTRSARTSSTSPTPASKGT